MCACTTMTMSLEDVEDGYETRLAMDATLQVAFDVRRREPPCWLPVCGQGKVSPGNLELPWETRG